MDQTMFAGSVPTLRQAFNRSVFSDALQDDKLVKEVIVDVSGYFEINCVDWDSYWGGSLDRVSPAVRRRLHSLRNARKEHVESGYRARSASSYVFNYFQLLSMALHEGVDDGFIQLLASFEVFPIRQYFSSEARAAGVIAARHPTYLLAKLRKPKAPDDPKFLPLVYLAGSSKRGSLYYHYRQLQFDKRRKLSVFVYPAANLEDRLSSFGCVDAFFSVLRSKPDPYGRRRAAAIADCAVGPFLRQHKNSERSRNSEIRIADLGGGTGSLLSHLCKRLLTHFPDVVDNHAFVWAIVDLSLQNPARHTTGRLLRPNLSMVEYIPMDYKSWLMQEVRKRDTSRWDVILLCRVLNNTSLFSIEETDEWKEIQELSGGLSSDSIEGFRPSYCLRPDVSAPDSLVASNAKASLRNGRSFQQLSLTDYFHAICKAYGENSQAERFGQVHFPLRRLNQDALRLDDGRWLLEQLVSIADLVVIEDVDLDEDRLQDYLGSNGSEKLAASNATERRRMQLSNLFCFTRRENAARLPGVRLW